MLILVFGFKALHTTDAVNQTTGMSLAWLLVPFFPPSGISQAIHTTERPQSLSLSLSQPGLPLQVEVDVDDVMAEKKKRLANELFRKSNSWSFKAEDFS